MVFAGFGDRLTVAPGAGLSLKLRGPHGGAVPPGADNLVLRAALLIGARDLAITLDKRLPPASGMGGGSSDAACAMRLAARAQGLALPDTEALMRLGADLPVCMRAPLPCRMQGLGEQVTPLAGIPPLWMLIANPGLPLATPSVFRALKRPRNPPLDLGDGWPDARGFAAWLAASTRNDLQAPALGLMPEIGVLLDRIADQPGCLLSRMTGSGATCFGLFESRRTLHAARAALRQQGAAPFVIATRSEGSPHGGR